MQGSKKIVRTTRIVEQTIKQQQGTHITRKIQRTKSPNNVLSSKGKQQRKRQKSEYSLSVSKSSENTIKKQLSSDLQKKESLQLNLLEEPTNLQIEFRQIKKMGLSKDFRDKLLKLQNYDANFSKQSEKLLKGSVEIELSRLLKMKNSEKQIKQKVYDTELLLACLSNQQQVNSNYIKAQADLESIKKANIELEKKLIQIQNINKVQKKQVSGAKQKLQQKMPKQLQIALNYAILALSNKQYPEAKKQMSTFIQKAKKQQSYQIVIKILNKTSSLATIIQQSQQSLRLYQSQLNQVIKNIDLSNKYLRQDKLNDLEKLQHKLKQNKIWKSQMQLSLFLESVLQNTKRKSKQLSPQRSKSKEKTLALGQSKNNLLEIQNLKKQINNLKQEVNNEKNKNSLLAQERVKEISEITRLRNIQKQFKSSQTESSTSPFNSSVVQTAKKMTQQKTKQLEQQKSSYQSKIKQLQSIKQSQEQKIALIQKKNSVLQLTLKDRDEELKALTVKYSRTQKQLNQVRVKFQKEKRAITTKNMSQSSNKAQQVMNVDQLKNLQQSFNVLSKEKQEEQYNYMRLLEDKQIKIKQYQTRLQAIDKFNFTQNNDILKLQLEQKQKQLIKLKKQLIQSLQGKQTTLLKQQSVSQLQQTQDQSANQALINEIMQIRKRKEQQTLSHQFNLQFNNIQREEWREVSKKIKQYKKKHPKNKLFIYLDQKHKYQFDLTQKLTDYQQKMLAIHNGIYRIKSIVTESTIETEKKYKGRQKQAQKWWQNIQLIHITEKMEFSKLFNDLIDQIHKFYTNGFYSSKSTPLKQLQPSSSDHINKQKQITIKEVKELQNALKILLKFLSNTDKLPAEAYSNSEYFTKLLPKLPSFEHISNFSALNVDIIKSFSQVIIVRQLYHTKKLSQVTLQNKTLNQNSIANLRQLEEFKKNIKQMQKQKKLIERNLQIKTKELLNKASMSEKIIQLQKIVKTYTYFKEVIEEEQKVVQCFIQQAQLQQYNKSVSKNSISGAVNNFKKKCPKNLKVIDYLSKMAGEVKIEQKKRIQLRGFIQNCAQALSEINETLNQENKIGLNQKINILSKKKSKLQELNQTIRKKYYSQSQFYRKTGQQLKAQVNQDQLLTQNITNLNRFIINYCKKLQETTEQQNQLRKKLSTVQLNYQQIKREVQQLSQMQKIFKQIMQKRILITKTSNISPLSTIQNEGFLYKNPQVIRQFYLDQINKKNKQDLQNMKKKNSFKSVSDKNSVNFSVFSINTKSEIFQHSNSIIETIFKLFSRINELHIQYQDCIYQKFQTSRISISESNQSLKQRLQDLQKQLSEANLKLKSMQRENKNLIGTQNISKQTQQQYQKLKLQYKLVEKQKKQLQSSYKKLQVFKKELEQQRALIDKILNSNQTSKSLSQSKQDQVSTFDQKKQLIAFKKNNQKSKFLLYMDWINKKLLSFETKYNILQNQKQIIILFYNEFTQLKQQNPNQWYKNYQMKIKERKDIKEIKGNNQLNSIFKSLIKQICQKQKQLLILKNKNLDIQCVNQSFSNESKEFKQLISSFHSLNQVFQFILKSIKQKFTSNLKQKYQLFTNQYYLKNLFQSQLRKKKSPTSSQLISLIQSISLLFHELSLQSNILYSKFQQQNITIKSKLQKQKQELNQRIIQLNLKNKEIQVLNRQFSIQNKLIKESIKKLQSSINYLQQNKKVEDNQQKSKDYELLRLKGTIENYVNQETKLEISVNKLEKDKKDIERQVEKLKKDNERLKDQIYDVNQEKNNLNRIIQTLKQQHNEKQITADQNETLINNLKINFAKNQKQLHAIEQKVASLYEQKHQLQQQLNKIKVEYKKEKQLLEKEASMKKINLENLQKNNNKLQKDNQQLTIKIKHLQNTKQMQISHLNSIIQRLESQNKQYILREKKQKDELLKRLQTISNEKFSIIQKHEEEVQKYRQRIIKNDLEKQKSKTTQITSFNKDIEEMNKNYSQLVKNYEKQKIQFREKLNKSLGDYQMMVKKINQEKIELISTYEHNINEERQIKLQEIKHLSNQNLQLKQQNQRLNSSFALCEKQMVKMSQQKHTLNIKFTQIQSKMQELQYKIQLNQQRLSQSQKSCLRLSQFQRKSRQYETILLQNNIGISSEGQGQRKSSNNSNNLQSRLKQFQLIRQKNYKLQAKTEKLCVSLEKQISQKQYLKQQSQLNREDYIKSIAESKQELRHLREENRILSYQKSISENQFTYYKENNKLLVQKNNQLEQEIRNLKVKFEKQQLILKDNIQKQFNFQIQYLQRQNTEKVIKISEFESQISRLKQKLNLQEQQNRSKQIQFIQLSSKLKQVETKAKSDKQKNQILSNYEKSQLKSQLQAVKSILTKKKFDLQMTSKDLSFYKLAHQEKQKENSKIKLQIQSIQKINKIQKSNYVQKMKNLQNEIQNVKAQLNENSKAQLQQKFFVENKQTSEITLIKKQLYQKKVQFDVAFNRYNNAEKAIKQNLDQIQNLKRYNADLQFRFDMKMKQNSDLSKQNLDLDMKIKDIERNNKFQNLQLKAQLDFHKRIYSQLQGRYQNLQRQLNQGKTPFSPSSFNYAQVQTKDNFSIKIQTLQNQNYSLKKQYLSISQKNKQIENNLLTLRSKASQALFLNQQKRNIQIQMRRLKQQTENAENYLIVLTNKNKQLQTLKNQCHLEIQSLHFQKIGQIQQSKLQLQKYKNSQRVLDHQLIEYKSKIQNIQECLKQQKQKTYSYRIQIEAIKRQNLSNSRYSEDKLALTASIEEQVEKLRLFSHQQEKQILTKDIQLHQFDQSLYKSNLQIQHLRSQILALNDQNQRLTLKQRKYLNFLNSQSIKLKQMFQILQSHENQSFAEQYENKTQYDMLMIISVKLQDLINKNNSLEKKCSSYETKLNSNFFSLNRELGSQEVIYCYVEGMIQSIVQFLISQDLIKNDMMMERIYENTDPRNIEQYFESVEEYFKYLIHQVANNGKGAQIIERYEWSLQNLKKLIKLYIENGDIQAHKSLQQICKQ